MSTALQISLQEYDAMIADGAFALLPDRRIELIHGELRQMTPPGPTHEYVIDLLTRWSFRNTNPAKELVRIQQSVGLAHFDSVPQPDIAWVVEANYRKRRPQAVDVLLVIEVSDSSRRYDRETKAALYASAGIADYWIVDIQRECIEVRRNPRDGEYTSLQTFGINDSVTPLQNSEATLRVGSLFLAE